MTKNITKFMALALSALAIVGCGGSDGPEKPVVTPSISVTPSEVSIDGNGGSATVIVKATTYWTVSGADSWIELKTKEGIASTSGTSFTISADANPGVARSEVLTFVLGNNLKSVTVTVNQGMKSGGDNPVNPDDPGNKGGEGTAEAPYSVAEALDLITGHKYSSDKVYVKGIVSGISEINAEYGNATYYISDDGTMMRPLMVYRGQGFAGAEFTSFDDLKLGDKVTVEGELTYYNNKTPEVTKGSSLSSYQSGSYESDVIKGSPAWLELPEVPSGDSFHARSMELGKELVRNYSFCWNPEGRVSLWVAYPLNYDYIGTYVERTDFWAFDPLIPFSEQQCISGGYGQDEDGNSYARGHQLPSADRRGNNMINSTTFYATNMTPQNNDFNAGIWADLEGQARTWAKACDTLYVVTGCVIDGASHHVADRLGNSVPVPVAYFKAFLRYNAKDAEPYSATAFWFDHEKYSGSLSSTKPDKDMAISVDELEKKLGYDLFVNLDGKVGKDKAAAIEKVANWW